MTTSNEKVDGLRVLADFLEEHPKLAGRAIVNDLYIFATDADDFRQISKQMRPCRRAKFDEFIQMRREFGGGVLLALSIGANQVCTRRQTGTRIEPARPEREVAVYEWDCPEFNGSGGTP